MTEAVQTRQCLYHEPEALPANLVGEIVNGRLHTQPRPAGPHAVAASRLGADLEGPYGRGRGGPGGWWIIDEPEVHLIRDEVVVVPDIGGWRTKRMPQVPRDHRFEIVPDWVCEILSPSTAKFDRTEKLPLYARFEVAHLWLLDLLARSLEVYRLAEGRWTLFQIHKDEETVTAPPFSEISIALAELWVGTGSAED